MLCPKCQSDTIVIDSRLTNGQTAIRRRRECLNKTCKKFRFTTIEYEVLKAPVLSIDIKQNFESVRLMLEEAYNKFKALADRCAVDIGIECANPACKGMFIPKRIGQITCSPICSNAKLKLDRRSTRR